MNIYYETSSGECFDWVLESDILLYTNTYQVAYSILSVDELAPLMMDLYRDGYVQQRKRNSDGYHKYYIDTGTGDIMEREAWTVA